MAIIYTNIIAGSEIQIDWQRAHDVYFTSGKMKDNTALNKFTKEEDTNYNDRKCNVATTNTYDTEVNSIVEKVFSEGRILRPTLNEKNEHYNPDIEAISLDIDRGGNGIDSFMERNAKLSRAMGTTFIVWDNVKVDKMPETKAGMKREHLPSATIYTPLNITVYGKDNNGMLMYFKFPIFTEDENGTYVDPTTTSNPNGSAQKYRVYRRYEDGEIEVYETEFNDIPSLSNTSISSDDGDDGKKTDIVAKGKMKFWPITECASNIPEQRYFIANSKNRKIHSAEEHKLNLESWKNEILKNNTFPVWVENADPTRSGVTKLTGTNVGVYYGKGMDAPSWVAPPSEPVKIILEDIARMEDNILKNMSSLSSIDSGASSETRQISQERRMEQLQRTATMSQMWEMDLMTRALKAFYITKYVYKVVYSKKFELLTSDLALAETSEIVRLLKEGGYSNGVVAHVIKSAIMKINPNDSDLEDLLGADISNMQANDDNDKVGFDDDIDNTDPKTKDPVTTDK